MGHRYELSIGARYSELESEEQRLFGQCGLTRCNPYWSWPLLESVLNLPASWYHRDGVDKILARTALRGRLPGNIIRAGRAGGLGSYYLRGLEHNRTMLRAQGFRHPHSDWKKYVDETWLADFLSDLDRIAFGHTILWRVICYEFWCRRIF